MRRITALRGPGDRDNFELVEDHPWPLVGGPAFSLQHYRRSPQVRWTRREGSCGWLGLRSGDVELSLIPSQQATNIDRVKRVGDRLELTYSGLGGAGRGITEYRANCPDLDLIGQEMIPDGARAVFSTNLWQKWFIGLDDTDSAEEGATWLLAHELGRTLETSGLRYLDHRIIQLNPEVPHRTTNCCGSVIVVATRGDEPPFGEIKNFVRDGCSSDEPGVACLNALEPHEALKEFGERTRRELIDNIPPSAREGLDVLLDGRGLVGAMASIGLAQLSPEAAAAVPD